MKNIGKEYYGNRVLKNVSFDLPAGSIMSLVGENGAGKSTMMNILFGMPVIHNTGGYDGEILFDGQAVKISSPEEAMKLGIGMVHQEFMLLPGFTIAENIKLNREITRKSLLSRVFGPSLNWLDMPAMRKDARASLDAIGLSVDEYLPVAGLPVGFMQFIEIARELDKENIKLLVLDEPTAVLTESEAEKLLDAMKMLAAKGISLIFISHRLDEVMNVSDSIIVLRDGEQVAAMKPSETSIDNVAELMVGRKIESGQMQWRPSETFKDDYILSVSSLKVDMPGEVVKDASLEIRRGEILGIGGLAGQGKIGIANGIMGLFPSSGTVVKNGQVMELNNTRAALTHKMAFVSEDRRGTGLLLEDSIEFNIAATATQVLGTFMTDYGFYAEKRDAPATAAQELGAFIRKNFLICSLLNSAKMREYALRMIKELDIRCTGPEQFTRRLSGGNQQKVCIVRALTLGPDLLFVSEPTRGVDVGAKKLILDLLVKLNREQGLTIVMTSSELAELRSICDRILIVYEGHVEGMLLPTDSDRDFGLMMAGKYNKKGAA